MAGFQFLRVETFAQVRGQLGPTRAAGGRGGKGGQQKLTARQAIEEATRAENCTPTFQAQLSQTRFLALNRRIVGLVRFAL